MVFGQALRPMLAVLVEDKETLVDVDRKGKLFRYACCSTTHIYLQDDTLSSIFFSKLDRKFQEFFQGTECYNIRRMLL